PTSRRRSTRRRRRPTCSTWPGPTTSAPSRPRPKRPWTRRRSAGWRWRPCTPWSRRPPASCWRSTGCAKSADPHQGKESPMTVELAPSTTLAEDLAARLELRTARVAIVGLGYVGLPLAETFAWGGYPVIGFDVDPEKVQKLRQGQSYIGH